MVSYKEFLINPTPYKLATDDWTIRVEILIDKGPSIAGTVSLLVWKVSGEFLESCVWRVGEF